MAAIHTAYFITLLFALAYGNEDNDSSKVLLCAINGPTPMGGFLGNLDLEDLDAHLCTHIIHNSGAIDTETHDIREPRGGPPGINDKLELGMIYNRTMSLRETNPELKVFLQVCCFRDEFWDNSTISHSQIVSTFIKNAVTYLKLKGFDGMVMVLDNYPNEQQLVRGLREEFDKKGLLLYSAFYPEEVPQPNAYQLTQEGATLFDRIIVADYWSLDHNHARIFSPLNELRKIISDYKKMGIPTQKFVAAIPTFTMSYKLCNASDTGLSAPLCGDGVEGTEHPSKMILIYSELMQKIRNATEGWVVQRDDVTGQLYAHSKSLHWTSYEDPVSVRAKAQFAREENLGGLAIITMEYDDAVGNNEAGIKLPLTKAAHDALLGN